MSVYVLNPNGSINASIKADLNSTQQKDKDIITFLNKNDVAADGLISELTDKQGYLIAIETLGDFKAGKNYTANSHTVFDGTNNSVVLSAESVDNNTSGVIGKSNNLYPYAFGTNMDVINPKTEALPFYRPYNSFFDLDHNYSGRNVNTERDVEIFADEAEMLYGIPILFNESEKFAGEIANAFSSLADMLFGAIIPIGAISLLQGLLQAAQAGPPDPFKLFTNQLQLGNPDKYGKFIQYIKFDISLATNFFSRLAVNLLNSLIDALVSLLKTSERLMNFPSNLVKPGLAGILNATVENTAAFCVGYILYLIPGFKLDERIKGSRDEILGALLGTITSLVSSSKCRHHYNLLLRKIVKNNYFRNQIQFKAKTITNVDGTTYTYTDQIFYQLSDFYHRFVGERIGVGHRTLGILKAREFNKKSHLFSVQRMNELPVMTESDLGAALPVPVPMGTSVLGGDKPADDAVPSSRNFNKSIYSLTSLVTKTSNANTYLNYHNELVKQNEAIYQKKEKRLSREHVQKIEGIINADYMPFSIQDLRTNEVFKFHAFTENISDSFSVGWEDAGGGFGRMDSIKTYKGTSRKIGVDFWLVSMSSEDFDYMWWMVNRLIALCYPQWSAPKPANLENQKKAGVILEDGKINGVPFSLPFTQIPTGSPLVRLRLGDIFTSNYSKKSMARIFGFDLEKNVNYKDKILVGLSDFKKLDLASYDNVKYGETELLGYDDTFDLDDYNDQLTGNIFFPFNTLEQNDFYSITSGMAEGKTFYINNKSFEKHLDDIQKLFIKYSNFYYTQSASVNLDDINNPPGDLEEGNNNDEMFIPTMNRTFKKLVYVPIPIIEDNKEKILMLLYSVIIYPSKNKMTAAVIKTEVPKIMKKGLYDLILGVQIDKYNDDGKLRDKVRNNLNLQTFMEASGVREFDKNNPARVNLLPGTEAYVNNPVIKSFESTMGEGLAGSIQGFSINFDQNIPWELTDGSRAPMAVKIGLQLDVIHDILPGLDDKGIMRAPTYRVGNLNNEFFGKSVYDDLPNNLVYTNQWPIQKEEIVGPPETAARKVDTVPYSPDSSASVIPGIIPDFSIKVPLK